jgi:hypothetical protein
MNTERPYTLELHVVSKMNPNARIILDAERLQGKWTPEQYLILTDSTNHLIEFTDGVIEVLDLSEEGVIDAR